MFVGELGRLRGCDGVGWDQVGFSPLSEKDTLASMDHDTPSITTVTNNQDDTSYSLPRGGGGYEGACAYTPGLVAWVGERVRWMNRGEEEVRHSERRTGTERERPIWGRKILA